MPCMTVLPIAARIVRRQSPSAWQYVWGAPLRTLLTAPVIYTLTLPLALLDLCVTVYQRICFPLYGITRVRRSRYFRFDRQRLPYLNLIEKAHCAYCTYANGVLAYTREVAARTETYWCPIKHTRPLRDAHGRYAAFFAYGDEPSFRAGLSRIRRTVTRVPSGSSGARVRAAAGGDARSNPRDHRRLRTGRRNCQATVDHDLMRQLVKEPARRQVCTQCRR